METGLRVLLNESCRKSEYLGGFGFCPSRPTNKFCRTRMRTNSSIGYAIVFDDKIDQIGKNSGVAPKTVPIRRSNLKPFLISLRSGPWPILGGRLQGWNRINTWYWIKFILMPKKVTKRFAAPDHYGNS